MVPRRHRSPYRVVMLAALVLAGLLLGASWPSTAMAAILQGCRGDPIVMLSNGAIIQMTVDISSEAANVRRIIYTVHVPRRTKVDRIIYTGGELAGKEVVNVYHDLYPGRYSTETVVRRNWTNVQVEATTRVLAGLEMSKMVAGQNGQHLVVHCSKRTGLCGSTILPSLALETEPEQGSENP